MFCKKIGQQEAFPSANDFCHLPKFFSNVTKLQRCRGEDLKVYSVLSGNNIICSLTATYFLHWVFLAYFMSMANVLKSLWLAFLVLYEKISQMWAWASLRNQKIGDYKIFKFLTRAKLVVWTLSLIFASWFDLFVCFLNLLQ